MTRIAVFDRWLRTLGGGERYLLRLAEVIGTRGSVDILTQTPVSPEVISARLGIDTTGMTIRHIASDLVSAVEKVSEEYDVFVNGSFVDPVSSRARRSLLVVLFPEATFEGRLGWLRQVFNQRMVPSLLGIPHLERGFHASHEMDGARVRWTDGDGRVRLRVVGSTTPTVVVPLAGMRPDGVPPRVRLWSGADILAEAVVPPGAEFAEIRVIVTDRRRDGSFELTVESDTFALDGDRIGVAVGDIRVGWRGRLYTRVLAALPAAVRARHPRYPGRGIPAYVGSYDRIVTISRFSQTWTRRYWGTSSDVLYPPVDVDRVAAVSAVRTNTILSVGRFFQATYNKKHVEMVDAFRAMVDEGLSGWELVLVGGVAAGPEHERYVERVRTAAEGLPARIVLDPSYRELIDLYARARIYWHAVGAGEDEWREPFKFEHFGITTVEAMAAGAVPVVIGRGGQRESIEDGVSGFLCRDLDEMRQRTWTLIRDPDVEDRMRAAARRQSGRFSVEAFRARAERLLDRVV